MEKTTVFLKGIILIAFVIIASFVSVKIWNEKPESIEYSNEIYFENTMSVSEFGEKNNLDRPLLKKLFVLNTENDLQKRLGDFNYSKEAVSEIIKKAEVLQSEEESKNWKKIFSKFLLWVIFLFVMFLFIRKKRLNNRMRILLYGFAVLLFGIILGSDPGPMGTIKDAIVLLGTHKVIFPPRMIALAFFLILVFVANKFICSWGCQAGTLQDVLFRINRNKEDKPIIKQYKIGWYAVKVSTLTNFFYVFKVMLCNDRINV